MNAPAEEVFGLYVEKAALDYDRAMRLLAKADADEVPEQLPAYRKSRAVISLQLIKRWRNLAYDRRHAKLRLPPSVLSPITSRSTPTRSILSRTNSSIR